MHDIIGSGITLNINIDKIGNLTMDDLSFKVRFFTVGGPYIEMYKDQLKRIDANNYIACIDTTDLKRGKLFMRAYISIPDNSIAIKIHITQHFKSSDFSIDFSNDFGV